MGDLNAACAAWIERIAAGDDAALGALYDATLAHCYGLALRITGNREAAEDVVAETYLQVWREAGSYSAQRGRPLAWLMMLTRSRALDLLRRARDMPPATRVRAEVLAELAGDVDPMTLSAAVQAGDRLHGAIAELPPTARQVLALVLFRGLTQTEIADYLGMPLGTVKSHLRRAQATLRETLADLQ